MTESNDKLASKKIDLGITEANWLLLKAIEKGMTIKDAYKYAGYKGEDSNAPYQLYHRLKKKLEAVYEADNVDSLHLKIEAKKILDMEVQKGPIRPEVKLKAIETLAKLTEHGKTEAKTISPFIVFKADDVQISQVKGKIIDAIEVETND